MGEVLDVADGDLFRLIFDSDVPSEMDVVRAVRDMVEMSEYVERMQTVVRAWEQDGKNKEVAFIALFNCVVQYMRQRKQLFPRVVPPFDLVDTHYKTIGER